MPHQSTFIMVKPDGVRRRLVGEVIARFEAKGLSLERMELSVPGGEIAARHYAEHRQRSFYAGLIDFITSGPVVAMKWSGESAVTVARTMIGSTDPVHAPPGTIRGDFGLDVQENIVHGSDSPDSAERELAIWFG
jgi:nucleoside-diphosphate kinase